MDAFYFACEQDRFQALEHLLSKGFDIDVQDCSKETPLMQAALCKKVKMCEWLLDHGADIHAQDVRKRTALDLAKTKKHPEVIELLEQRMGR